MNDNDKKTFIQQFLGFGNIIPLNRYLIRILGLDESILLAELISKHSQFENDNKLDEEGLFYLEQKLIEYNTTLTEFKQRKVLLVLKEINFIDYKRKGSPPKYYFKILYNNIFDILGNKEKHESVTLKIQTFKNLTFKPKENKSINNINKYKKKINIKNIKSESPIKNLFIKKINYENSSMKEEIDIFFNEMKKLHPKIKKDTIYNPFKIYKYESIKKDFINGFPLTDMKIRNFIKKYNIPYNADNGFESEEKFNEYMINALKCLLPDYFPDLKGGISYNFENFLYNKFSDFVSYFLFYGFNCEKVKLKKIAKEKYPNIVQWYSDYFSLPKSNELIEFVNKIALEHEKIINYEYKGYKRRDIDENEDFINHCLNLNDFIQEHIYWLEEQMYREDFQLNWNWLNPSNKEKSLWSYFKQWYFNKFDNTSLYPLDETMEWKLQEYLERIKNN